MPASTSRATKSRRASTQAASTGLVAGDYVTNPLKPEWGPGKVIDLQRNVVYVYFRDRPGKEVIRMKQDGLRAAEADAELEAMPAFVEKKTGGFGQPPRKRAAKKTKPTA